MHQPFYLLFILFLALPLYTVLFFFFFNDTATTEIYTLSLHDALPICAAVPLRVQPPQPGQVHGLVIGMRGGIDRKSTRLNSSHGYISYAVFCLKKKKKKHTRP